MQRMRIVLKGGEVVIGTPNHASVDGSEIEIRSGRLFDPASTFRTLKADEIESSMTVAAWQRVTR